MPPGVQPPLRRQQHQSLRQPRAGFPFALYPQEPALSGLLCVFLKIEVWTIVLASRRQSLFPILAERRHAEVRDKQPDEFRQADDTTGDVRRFAHAVQ